MRKILLAVFTVLSTVGVAFSAPDAPRATDAAQTFTSGHARTILLELYTSEGCSSCPPAEAWLSRLVTNPHLWHDVVPVSFHVNYWDGLGWTDRFASAAATDRQRAYAAAWGNDSVYTPGFVQDGHERRGWSGLAAGEFPPPAAAKPANAGELRATTLDGKTVHVTYHPGDPHAARCDVTVALLGFGLNSKVKAGENQGRSLTHDFVVLASKTQEIDPRNPEESATFELPAGPAEANRLALAVWVQGPGNGSVLQATGGWLITAADKPRS